MDVTPARTRRCDRTCGTVWSDENLFHFLAKPKEFVKGTNMAFPGFKKEQDRADVVAYLNTCK